MGAEQSYNFRRISENLTTSGVVGEDNLRELGAEGYQLVVNLLPNDSQYAVAGEKEIVEEQGIRYVYIPVDFSRPSLEDFSAFSAALDAAGDVKAHVHCAANFRVSAFYSLYARRAGTMTDAEAEALISSLWRPDENPGWPEFIDAVKSQ